MKYLIILAFLCSCSSTEKLLQSKTQSEVVRIEKKRFDKKQLPPPRDYKIYSIVSFIAVALILQD